jgi:hypothetical protein
MIQIILALALLVSLIAGVIWVVVRELAKSSRRKRQLEALWQAELRQDVATDPRFWHSDPAVGRKPAGAGWTAKDARDR